MQCSAKRLRLAQYRDEENPKRREHGNGVDQPLIDPSGEISRRRHAQILRPSLDQFDAIFALGLKFTRESLRGVQRLALIARWGVGYDMIDVEAITEAGVLLAITPKAVRGPVPTSTSAVARIKLTHTSTVSQVFLCITASDRRKRDRRAVSAAPANPGANDAGS